MQLTSGLRIESGTVAVFGDYPKGEMWTGYGPRQKTLHVDFSGGPFHKAPAVTLAISTLDASNTANTRVATTVADLTASGFTIVASTWADTKLATVGVTWLAIGE